MPPWVQVPAQTWGSEQVPPWVQALAQEWGSEWERASPAQTLGEEWERESVPSPAQKLGAE